MSASSHRPRLTLASLNVNGLRDARKRAGLFHRLHARTDGVDVLLLQETHHESQAEADEWMCHGLGPGMPWRGHSAWAHGTRASRGVAVLVHESLPVDQVEVRHSDPEGRVVVVTLRVHGQCFRLASVYAPCVAAERAGFFGGVLRQALPVLHGHECITVVGGDFNCIDSLSIDQVGGSRARCDRGV
jgi:exonuclease III